MNKLHTSQSTLARYIAGMLEPISERLEIAYWENTAYVNVRREKVWIQIFIHNITGVLTCHVNYGGGDVPDARLLEGGDDKELLDIVQHVINLEQERAA
jgi:hypothetical protein